MAHTLPADHSSASRNGTKRVATLIASATEIVSALGCRDWIVGRSHECDYPPGISAVPVLTEPKFPLHGSSGEIDRHVKAIVEEGTSVYRVYSERLKGLNPDVIVTQDHCEVCAVSLKDVEQAICNWTGHDIQVVCPAGRTGWRMSGPTSAASPTRWASPRRATAWFWICKAG